MLALVVAAAPQFGGGRGAAAVLALVVAVAQLGGGRGRQLRIRERSQVTGQKGLKTGTPVW